MPALFGFLDHIPGWKDLPYPTKGALLRGLKAALSALVGVLLAAATAGALFPESFALAAPLVVILTTAFLQAVDKFLRETAIAGENQPQLDPGDPDQT